MIAMAKARDDAHALQQGWGDASGHQLRIAAVAVPEET